MHNTLKIFLLPAVVLTLFICCVGEKDTHIDSMLSITITKTAESPVIDGLLNDSCWKDARVMSLILCADGQKPLYPTTVRVSYDDAYLYIGFECQDPDAASSIMENDGPVIHQDHVSVYIDAGNDAKSYAVIDVAPTGAYSDAYVLSYSDGVREKILPGWNCEGLRISVSVYGGGARPGTQDRFWTVEMAMPLVEFVTAPEIPPSPGDMWRINFHRVDITNTMDFSAFAPTGTEDFHKPSKFARLYFER